MSDEKPKLSGPDLTQGIELSIIPDGSMLLGHALGEPVLLIRRGAELFAIGATCTHYGAPLVDGLLVGETVRCPWHHACFSLRTGEALRAPALDPISVWRVEAVRDLARQYTPLDQPIGAVYVREKLVPVAQRSKPKAAGVPDSIVIVGGGGAGNAAAEALRTEGYSGRITMLSADASPPYDRPNLSKGALAGTGAAEVMPPRDLQFYQRHNIDLKLNTCVVSIDVPDKKVVLKDGSRHGYGALLLATGSDPVKLNLPGADLPHVHYLRSLADGNALIASAKIAKRVVVIGASFIGLEVAAALRARKLDVQIVGPESVPMGKILGAGVGNFIRELHEQHGVKFHLGRTPTSIDATGVVLDNGIRLEADLVVVGIGVRPRISLAARSGLLIDRGVSVNEYLETSIPGVFAAGDIARWPDPLTGDRIRVEHWVVAERQGHTAAHNMLGLRKPFDEVPFFWTEQYDFGLAYVGHAEEFDHVQIDGELSKRECTITYTRSGQQLAIAVVHRDLEGLRAEVEFERRIASKQTTIVHPPELKSA
ncbi:MAG: FAD-dependent oxidoreductase [Steroidobacteraceae bacterium]